MKRTRRIKSKNIVCNERRAHNGHFMNVEHCEARLNRALAFNGMRVIPTHLRSIAAVTYWDPLNEIKMKNHVDSPVCVRNQFYKIFNIYFVGIAFPWRTGMCAATANGEQHNASIYFFQWRWCPFDILYVARGAHTHTHSPTQLSTLCFCCSHNLTRMQSRMIQ